MINSKFKWQLDQPANQDVVDKLSKDANIDPFVAKLLVQRDITTAEGAESFMNPSVSSFHDPFF